MNVVARPIIYEDHASMVLPKISSIPVALPEGTREVRQIEWTELKRRDFPEQPFIVGGQVTDSAMDDYSRATKTTAVVEKKPTFDTDGLLRLLDVSEPGVYGAISEVASVMAYLACHSFAVESVRIAYRHLRGLPMHYDGTGDTRLLGLIHHTKAKQHMSPTLFLNNKGLTQEYRDDKRLAGPASFKHPDLIEYEKEDLWASPERLWTVASSSTLHMRERMGLRRRTSGRLIGMVETDPWWSTMPSDFPGEL